MNDILYYAIYLCFLIVVNYAGLWLGDFIRKVYKELQKNKKRA